MGSERDALRALATEVQQEIDAGWALPEPDTFAPNLHFVVGTSQAHASLLAAITPALLLSLLDDAERYRALKSETVVFNSTSPNSGYYYCSADYLLDSPTGRIPTLDEYADAIRAVSPSQTGR